MTELRQMSIKFSYSQSSRETTTMLNDNISGNASAELPLTNPQIRPKELSCHQRPPTSENISKQ